MEGMGSATAFTTSSLTKEQLGKLRTVTCILCRDFSIVFCLPSQVLLAFRYLVQGNSKNSLRVRALYMTLGDLILR